MSALILIADDEPGILEMLRFELTQAGHEVIAVGNGAKAINQLQEAEFDLVISDVRMPGLSGLDVLRAAKELSPETEVVIATGYAETEGAIECVRGGAFDYIQKPFDLNDVLSVVERAIERRHLRAASALYQASQAVFANSGRQQLPEVIAAVAKQVMNADDVSLMLPDGDGRLRMAYSSGLDGAVTADARLALGERVAGRVAASREPALLPDALAGDPRFADVVSHNRVHSSIVYPLVARDRVVGVLSINRVTNQRRFRRSDLQRASVIAAQILLALENAELLRQMTTAERLASVGQLASGVAHEINNPLSYVLANQEFLQGRLGALRKLAASVESGDSLQEVRGLWRAAGGETLVDDCQRALAEVGDGARMIVEIAKDLRSLARSHDLDPEPLDLNEPIRSALRVASVRLKYRASVLTRFGANVEVLGHGGRLCQVFVNLLVNAAQAFDQNSPHKNQVVVETQRVGDQVIASVSDNGPGIDPTVLPRVFETFFTTKGPSSGTGLGLPISREIILGLKGEIRVESTPGRGAKFIVTLPWAGPAKAQPAKGIPPNVTPVGDRPRVLVVDDEPMMLRSYKRSLGEQFEVLAASGGVEALEVLRGPGPFAAIICDLMMPNLSGMELYRTIVQERPDLGPAFIFVSGSLMQQEVQAFVREVGPRVLEKPCELRTVRDLIELRCRGKRPPA